MNEQPRAGFPAPAWAWPSGALDLLLRAACLPDAAAAMADFEAWLAGNDIDDVPFRDHRLLAAVAQRFGKGLAARPEYPRLIGLQRHLWTRSRMAMADCLPLLAQMAEAGVTPTLLKGAARIAARPDDQKARVAHDIDILLPPERFRAGLELLLDGGWEAATGDSRLRLLDHAAGLRAMNFFGGRFGDIDLHQWAYGDTPLRPDLEADLLAALEPARLLGTPVTIPAPTDRLALAICHSGRDAHAHSDWIVDCAQIIADGLVDWPRLVRILARADAVMPGRIALGYMRHRLDAPVPDEALAALEAAPDGGLASRIYGLLEAKPRSEWTLATRAMRGVAKQVRLSRNIRTQALQDRSVRGRRLGAGAEPSGEVALDHWLGAPPEGLAGRCRFDLIVALDLPACRRRIELELNSDKAHLMQLRHQVVSRRGGPARLRFAGELDLPTDTVGLWLASRPGRHLRPGAEPDERARYAALPLRVESWRIEKA